jgi:iron complex outermembrane receptor protein
VQSQFLATAGVLNRCSYNALKDILPTTERASLLANGEYEVSSALTLRAQLLYSRNRQDSAMTPWTLNGALLPASNAFNPFGQDVSVSYAFDVPQLARSFEFNSDFTQVLVGGRGRLFGDWTWALDAWAANIRDRDHRPANFLNAAAVGTALAASDPNAALNVFTSGSPTSDAILSSLASDATSHYRAQTRAVSGFVQDGQLRCQITGGLSAITV